jgi:hypothetical protein
VKPEFDPTTPNLTISPPTNVGGITLTYLQEVSRVA